MRIQVRLYGELRRRASAHPLQMHVPEGATVTDVIASLGLRSGEVWLASLDNQLVKMDHRLRPEDELALIPPVGGG
jgi:molybdopterin synthase sulfur carrier subunit